MASHDRGTFQTPQQPKDRDARARDEARRQNDAGDEVQQPPDQTNLPPRNRRGTADVPGQAGGTTSTGPSPKEREGATESQTGDRTGPAVGYNQEPPREEDEGGVS